MAKKRDKTKISKPVKVEKPTPETPNVPSEVEVVKLPVKVCRLCEIQDGPFLNIFGAENHIAQKIQELMPLVIAENDDLPQIICFRCSAKVEELHEFVQKCITTQNKMRFAVDRTKNSQLPKTATRLSEINKWKDSLNKSRVTNDDICDAVIKKAMGYIKDIPADIPAKTDTEISPGNYNGAAKYSENSAISASVSNKSMNDTSHIDDITRANKFIPETSKENTTSTFQLITDAVSRSKIDKNISSSSHPNVVVIGGLTIEAKRKKSLTTSTDLKLSSELKDLNSKNNEQLQNNIENPNLLIENPNQAGKIRVYHKKDSKREPQIIGDKHEDKETESDKDKHFNIMDYVSTIKVNGVGLLFQCKLCNRNFLKKEVLKTHGCAKHGTPKANVGQNSVPVQPPKAATVKYINTKQDKDVAILAETDTVNSNCMPFHKIEESKTTFETKLMPEVEIKTKPKIGPASKVRHKTYEPASKRKKNEYYPMQ